MSLGRSGKCSLPPEVRNCSRKLPDFMFGDGSELASRSRNYNYAYGRTREEGEELHAPERFQKQEILLRVERSREEGKRNPPESFQKQEL